MRTALLTLAVALTAATASAYDFTALQQQLMASPAAQQAVAQTVASNPQLATSTASSMATMLGNLTPSQTQLLSTQVQAITQKLFTPAEQTKLTQFQATPEGASIVSKLPALAQQLAPVLLQLYMSQSAGIAPSTK
ncbi:MAG: hypothetical protein GC129_00530 [Proteobacteria bacterium]|nr:hypothetical protein [Pseudomonadota bacterium]